jgi:hypothetical protein
MMSIGVDYHPSFQTIAFLIEETGEYDERESYGVKRGEPSWGSLRLRPGRVGGGKSCWSCWTAWIRASRS